LRGKVSIYINHKKHDEFDENDDLTESKVFSEIENSQLNSSNFAKSKKFREKLGNYVTSLGKIKKKIRPLRISMLGGK
jgi:hypothetical protein